MYILLYILFAIITYIVSFKENFTKEKLEKVAPIFMILALFCVLMIIVKLI